MGDGSRYVIKMNGSRYMNSLSAWQLLASRLMVTQGVYHVLDTLPQPAKEKQFLPYVCFAIRLFRHTFVLGSLNPVRCSCAFTAVQLYLYNCSCTTIAIRQWLYSRGCTVVAAR